MLKWAKKMFQMIVLQHHSVKYLTDHPAPDQYLLTMQRIENERILEDLENFPDEADFSDMYLGLMYNHHETGMGRKKAKVRLGNGGIQIMRGEYRFRDPKGEWDAIGVFDKPNGFGAPPMSLITRWALEDSVDPETKEVVIKT